MGVYMQLLQELDTTARQDSDRLTKMGRLIGLTAGYLRRARAKDVIADVQDSMMRVPERYITVAAAIGLVLGFLVLRGGGQRG